MRHSYHKLSTYFLTRLVRWRCELLFLFLFQRFLYYFRFWFVSCSVRHLKNVQWKVIIVPIWSVVHVVRWQNISCCRWSTYLYILFCFFVKRSTNHYIVSELYEFDVFKRISIAFICISETIVCNVVSLSKMNRLLRNTAKLVWKSALANSVHTLRYKVS